jgi:hypothetical protein
LLATKERDDLRVARADRDDRDDRRQRDEEAEVGVVPQRPEHLLGAVARRGKPVGAEAHPREDRDERDLVEKVVVAERARAAEQE